MLVYLVIFYMGFMLLGIIIGVVSGDVCYVFNVYSLVMFYVIVYVLMSMGIFGMILMMVKVGFEVDNFEDFKGLNKCSFWFVGIMLMLMFLMVGVFFFIGFFVKFFVL